MSRNIDPDLAAAVASGVIAPITMAMLTFRTATRYVWSGVGDIVWDGNTFTGVGSLGSIGDMAETTEVKADGTTLMLSGIDPIYLAESLNDIQHGLPAKVWFGALSSGVIIGTPYLQFSGTVDKASILTGDTAVTIQLALEKKMIDHGRASQRRWTSADQHANGFPDDTAFAGVEALNMQALNWGG